MIRSKDLVLAVSQQSSFDIRPYERFLEQLTVIGGPQQAEALRIAGRYLLGGRYATLNNLAAENWASNAKLREHHGQDERRFMATQELGSLLAGSIDHATATGKSYIIFGAAVLALTSGHVDRVLVLCPSKTIEDGLTTKFRTLSGDSALMDLLPSAAFDSISIVNAYEGTVPAGAICVENVHAAYERSLSSIRDSFEGQGERTLVINDEAHHVYTSETARPTRKWTEFLLDPVFGFRRVLNASGTCFIGDDYFPDVIHSYSLQEARADRRIKDVRYWETDGRDFPTVESRWKGVLEEHERNRRLYAGIKPITIFVTQKVDDAKQLHEDFTAFLAVDALIAPEDAASRTLIVSSRPEHQANVAILRAIDAPGNSKEFVFSVSMLTESWDVKNVLMIVPHEKRAFDSKLLISQVLGRGLRLLPDPYRDARVVIFNHARWAPEMRRLFDDVWSDDQRIISSAVAASPLHFDLDLLRLSRGTATDKVSAAKAKADGLSLLPQRTREIAGSLVNLEGSREERAYEYLEPVENLGDILADIESKEMAQGLETGDWKTSPTAERRAAVFAALRAIGVEDDQVSETNKMRIWAWLRPQARGGKRAAVRTIERVIVPVSTRDLSAQSRWRSELNRDGGIALRVDNARAIRWPDHDTGQYNLLDSILADESIPRGAIREVTQGKDWRTPVDVVIVSHRPEREFLRVLVERAENCGVNSWLKSPDKGFYSIPYTLISAGTPRSRAFNPDWFMRVGNDILVVETKLETDASDENRAKLRDASDYFAQVNELRAAAGQSGQYHFYFLAPPDYTAFFNAIASGDHGRFVSTLQAELS